MTLTPEIKQRSAIEAIKFVLYIVSLVIAAMLFYGAIDKRVTILETEMPHKVDQEQLFDRLEDFKQDINNKIELEVRKLKNERR